MTRVILFLFTFPVVAGEIPVHYYPDPTEINIYIGIDEDDFARGLTMVAAGSSHQFDYSTEKLQLSITGSWLLDVQADAVSVGLGRKAYGVLWHSSYTRSRIGGLFVVGGSIHF